MASKISGWPRYGVLKTDERQRNTGCDEDGAHAHVGHRLAHARGALWPCRPAVLRR